MFLPNGMVGSRHVILEVPQHGVDPLEGLVLNRLFAGACDDGLVPTAGILKSAEAAQAIALDGETRRQVLLAPALEFGTSKPGDGAELDADRLAFGGRLDGRDKRRLTRAAAPGRAIAAFPAKISVIDFHPVSGQRLVMITFQHDLHELLFQFPGRILRHAQTTAQFDTGYSFLALGQVIHRGEPRRQRQFRAVENRPSN